jgi:hypothetical protein
MRAEYAEARGVVRREHKHKLGQVAAVRWRGDSDSTTAEASKSHRWDTARRHDVALASKAAQHGCTGRRNTAIGSRGAITAQAQAQLSIGAAAAGTSCGVCEQLNCRQRKQRLLRACTNRGAHKKSRVEEIKQKVLVKAQKSKETFE